MTSWQSGEVQKFEEVLPEEMVSRARAFAAKGFVLETMWCSQNNHGSFQVFYVFQKTEEPVSEAFGFLISVPSDAKGVPSLTDAFQTAQILEDEITEFFGLNFLSTQKKEIPISGRFLPEGWPGFPLRKEYRPPDEFNGVEHLRLRSQKKHERN